MHKVGSRAFGTIIMIIGREENRCNDPRAVYIAT